MAVAKSRVSPDSGTGSSPIVGTFAPSSALNDSVAE